MATKIVNNLSNPLSDCFRNVESGHFFLDSDGALCIRTDDMDVPGNAFCLEADCFLDMYAQDRVIPVNVTISIDSYLNE